MPRMASRTRRGYNRPSTPSLLSRRANPMSLHTRVNVRVSADGAVSRRGFLQLAGAAAGLGLSSALAARADELKKQNRACILLWMAGGPSQFETFDPKPGAETQGPTRAIPTSVPSIQIAEHWTRTARVLGDLA